MITKNADKNGLLADTGEAVAGLQNLMAALDEGLVNTIPFESSWTAGQLFRHVAKSINGIAGAMKMRAKPANRDVAERVPELQETFLNFESKMKSPGEIEPEAGRYNKQAAMHELAAAFNKLKDAAGSAHLMEVVEGLPLGAITKLEMLHFVLYHTQRHLHQMETICAALQAA